MSPSPPSILTVNGGSSSIKFALFEVGDPMRRVLKGGIDRIGLPESVLWVKHSIKAENFSRPIEAPDHAVAADQLTHWIASHPMRDSLIAVGHRVVHGGPKYWKPTRITDALVNELRRLSPLDPLLSGKEVDRWVRRGARWTGHSRFRRRHRRARAAGPDAHL